MGGSGLGTYSLGDPPTLLWEESLLHSSYPNRIYNFKVALEQGGGKVRTHCKVWSDGHEQGGNGRTLDSNRGGCQDRPLVGGALVQDSSKAMWVALTGTSSKGHV